MLVRAFTYRTRDMDTMVKKAVSGGCDGVLHIERRIRSMPQREVEIVNKLGLHARASAKLTQLAAKYQSDVALSRNNRKVNAKSIMGVMMLAAGKGAKVTLEIDGPDEAEAMEAIVALISDYFGEGQ